MFMDISRKSPELRLKHVISKSFNENAIKYRKLSCIPPFNFYLGDNFENAVDFSYIDFFECHLLPNKPCIFPQSFTKNWKSRKEWVDEYVKPNFDFLTRRFGDVMVPVANCGIEQYSSHPKQEMKFSDYLQYWKRYIDGGYKDREECLYLKDWHFIREFPDYSAYTTPKYFTSDWLNEFWDTRTGDHDDYRFVYMGPKGSWTPFHADVFRSYSWSANICGRKKWILFPPGEEECLKDKYGHLVYDVTSEELNQSDLYPKYSQLKHKVEIIQEAGEIIFVPSGWHHQVHNLEDTISINHNWLNGCNVDICWSYIKHSLSEVQKEIADCRDMDGWHQQCQLILKASSGIDFTEFFAFMMSIAKKRLELIQKYKDINITEYNTGTEFSVRTKTKQLHRECEENVALQCGELCHLDCHESSTKTKQLHRECEENVALQCGELCPLDCHESSTKTKQLHRECEENVALQCGELCPLDCQESSKLKNSFNMEEESSKMKEKCDKLKNDYHGNKYHGNNQDLDSVGWEKDLLSSDCVKDNCVSSQFIAQPEDKTMDKESDLSLCLNHLKFDLQRIRFILEDMLNTPEFAFIDSLQSNAVNLLSSIKDD